VADLVDKLVAQQQEETAVLRLVNGPFVTNAKGHRLDVPDGSKRLLVFVALRPGRVERRYAAGTLWPIGDDGRASGNLRSALWRLNRARVDLILADKHSLKIRQGVVVDVHLVCDWTARLITGKHSDADLFVRHTVTEALDLLPGWYDDWVLLERERLRQQVLHGLEALSAHLTIAGRYAEAIDAAIMAVNAEPLRESAQRALLHAHLTEGNWVEARRGLESYRSLLREELGIDMNPKLTVLLQSLGRAGSAAEPARRDPAYYLRPDRQVVGSAFDTVPFGKPPTAPTKPRRQA
jgi:DNA-binding SARP family transcriptional activator